jgi:hypothetical protein
MSPSMVVICWLSGCPATPWIWALTPFSAFGNAASVAVAGDLEPVVRTPLIVVDRLVAATAMALVDELVVDALPVPEGEPLDDELLEPQPASASIAPAAAATSRRRCIIPDRCIRASAVGKLHKPIYTP